MIRSTDAIPFARGIANRYMEKAVAALSPLGVSRVHEELMVIGAFMNQRSF
ncbi:hypothetical protein GCM10025857_38880 [Alicyclobacillus contaminans]|nr:hypothetical protein GCM10025857_38880 [Alicyclobacillus contaminans]